MMKAPVFHRPGSPLVIESVPEPGDYEVLVKVHRCGICGSDLHITDGTGFTTPPGSILGHETAGEVVAVGGKVSRLRVGDRATAMPIIGCGACRYCLEGKPAYCAGIRYAFGGFAEYALMHEGSAVKIPDTLSSTDAALVEPLAVALHGVAMAGLPAGAGVLIQGAGPIGLAAMFWAKRMGAGRVDVIEGAPVRAAIATAMGADSVCSPGQGAAEPLRPAPELVIECVGRPGVLAQGIERVARGGTVVSLGYCFQPDTFVPALAGAKELRILFPEFYTMREFEHVAEVLDRSAVEPSTMITRTVGYDELPTVFDSLRKDPVDCKVQIDPQQV